MITAPVVQAPVPVPRLWAGETTVVIGGGTSLTPADVDSCRGKARVVAIKEASLLAPWADVLYSCEMKWWRFQNGAPTFHGLKYSLEATDYPDVGQLTNTGESGLECDPAGVRHGFNSGYQAVNLAYHLMGSGRLVLLGFDMWPGPTGDQNWFGDHPNHLRNSPYPIFLQMFRTLEDPLREAGVAVLNASRRTIMTSFPRVPLEEALA